MTQRDLSTLPPSEGLHWQHFARLSRREMDSAERSGEMRQWGEALQHVDNAEEAIRRARIELQQARAKGEVTK